MNLGDAAWNDPGIHALGPEKKNKRSWPSLLPHIQQFKSSLRAASGTLLHFHPRIQAEVVAFKTRLVTWMAMVGAIGLGKTPQT